MKKVEIQVTDNSGLTYTFDILSRKVLEDKINEIIYSGNSYKEFFEKVIEYMDSRMSGYVYFCINIEDGDTYSYFMGQNTYNQFLDDLVEIELSSIKVPSDFDEPYELLDDNENREYSKQDKTVKEWLGEEEYYNRVRECLEFYYFEEKDMDEQLEKINEKLDEIYSYQI